MSTPALHSDTHSSPGQLRIDPRLLELLLHLRNLPDSLSDHPGVYPFIGFTLAAHSISHYGSVQRALDHELQLIFGSRAGGSTIEFRGRGGSLEAIVYTLHKCIDGESGDNLVLWKWVKDLTHAALKASETAASAPKSKTRTKRRGRKLIRAATSKPTASDVQAAKARSAVRYPHDPADLEDDPIDTEPAQGRARSVLLDKLVIPCHSIVDPAHLRVRCRGTGCGWSWCEPRQTGRILQHSVRCAGLDEALRIEAKQHGAALSLASKLQATAQDDDTSGTITIGKTRLEKDRRVNHALLKWLCDRMIPPSAVDCYRWKEFISTLDANANTASGTTITDTFVTTEAAYIHQKSVESLSQQEQLTLSFDGGTTRKHESVYTVHVAAPLTREPHLMEGNEASGVSHTAEHVCSIIDKTLQEIGPERFASVVSDNAGNTRAARELVEKEYPWIIALQDACHLLNNAAKDIGQLEYFQPCITKLKTIITYFHSSSYAARHLASLRVLYRIARGLAAIGLTRFATYYYASLSTLLCLPLIRELLSSGVLDFKPNSPVYWMLDRTEVQAFEQELLQLVAVLEPLARAIKCLESTHSTLSDVYLLWLAILARFQDMFKHNTWISGVGLPSPVIKNITSILNGRHNEMFHGRAGAVYLGAFFLDIRYRGSEIFMRHPARPSTTYQTSYNTQASTNLLPDQDLRQSLPAYTLAGNYLVKLLVRIYNRDPDAVVFSQYTSWPEIETAFRNQLVLYTRGLSPFHQTPKPSTEHLYWESLRTIPSADILSHLGLVLTSIVPNSMAEERSMSTLTKLNSPDRASQKVSTLIDMAAIRQHYKREENQIFQVPHSVRPSVRFTELPRIENNFLPNELVEPSTIEQQQLIDGSDYIEDVLALGESRDCEDEGTPAPQGNEQYFEVELSDGVTLSSHLLIGMISDRSPASNKLSHPPELPLAERLPPTKRQRVDFETVAF